MSDREMPDPIDKAYVEAEALLSDDAVRAARRARLLAAVQDDAVPFNGVAAAAPMAAASASPPESIPPEPASVPPPYRPSFWRRNSWLAAACVAGLGVLIAAQFYQPIHPARQPAKTHKAFVKPSPETPPPLVAQPPAKAPPPPPALVKPSVIPPPVPLRVASPVVQTAPVQSTPPVVSSENASNSVQEVVVTGSRIQHPGLTSASPITTAPTPKAARDKHTTVTIVGGANAPDANGDVTFTYAPPVVHPAPVTERRDAGVDGLDGKAKAAAKPAFAEPAPPPPPPPPPPPGMRGLSAGFAAPSAADLATAAAAGRTHEVEVLLQQGVAVDAVDAKGDTALMRSIRADKPAVAAVLRAHGASLDRKNKAGVSARDMAKTVNDAKLDKALGIER